MSRQRSQSPSLLEDKEGWLVGMKELRPNFDISELHVRMQAYWPNIDVTPRDLSQKLLQMGYIPGALWDQLPTLLQEQEPWLRGPRLERRPNYALDELHDRMHEVWPDLSISQTTLNYKLGQMGYTARGPSRLSSVLLEEQEGWIRGMLAWSRTLDLQELHDRMRQSWPIISVSPTTLGYKLGQMGYNVRQSAEQPLVLLEEQEPWLREMMEKRPDYDLDELRDLMHNIWPGIHVSPHTLSHKLDEMDFTIERLSSRPLDARSG